MVLHLLSDLEYAHFLILDWATTVIEIREQVGLPIGVTKRIAQRRGLSHPWNKAQGRYRAVSTDLVYRARTQSGIAQYARAVKYESALNELSQLQGLELERVYWDEHASVQTDWKIVTEQLVPDDFVENIHWVHPFGPNVNFDSSARGDLDRAFRLLYPALHKSSERLCDITDWCDGRLKLVSGTALTFTRHFIATKRLFVDMHARIIPTRSLQVLSGPQPDYLL